MNDATAQNSTVLDNYGPAGGPTVVAHTNSDGTLSQIDGPRGSTTVDGAVSYDYSAGRLSSSTSIDGITSYGYDSNGFLSSLALPDGTTVSIVSSSTGKVERISISPPSDPIRTTSFSYEDHQTTVSNPDGSHETFPFDDQGQPLEDPDIRAALVQNYMDQNQVSQSEAESAITVQERSAGLQDSLDQALGSDFGGMWYEPSDGGRIKVLLTASASTTTAQSVVANYGVSSDTDFVTAAHTLDQLSSAADALDTPLQQLLDDGKVTTSVDLPDQRVEIETTNNLSSDESAQVQSAADAASAPVHVTTTDKSDLGMSSNGCRVGSVSPRTFTGCTRPLRGGMGLKSETFGETCSSGFVSYEGNGRQRIYHVLTAGHCIDGAGGGGYTWDAPYAYPNKKTWYSVGESDYRYANGTAYHPQGFRVDFGSIKVDTGLPWDTALKPWVAHLGGNHPDPHYLIKRVGTAVSGDVCFEGAVSGVKCGSIDSKHLHYTFVDKTTPKPYVRTTGTTHVKMKCGTLDPPDPGMHLGDSGSPVVAWHSAVGLDVGGGGCDEYFQPVQAHHGSAFQVTGVHILTTKDAQRANVASTGPLPVASTPPSAAWMDYDPYPGVLPATFAVAHVIFNPGTWISNSSQPVTYETQIQACDVTGLNCIAASGCEDDICRLLDPLLYTHGFPYPSSESVTSTDSNFVGQTVATPVVIPVGFLGSIRVQVTATNENGSKVAQSPYAWIDLIPS